MAEPDEGKTQGAKPAGAEPPADRRARRGSGLRALASTLPKVTRRALRRRGYAEGALAAEWPAIVGDELAARCLPEKLAIAQPGRRERGMLRLRVAPGHALEIQHLAPLLIERINGYFGYRAVDDLRLRQVAVLSAAPPAAAAPPRRLGAAEEAELRRRVAVVEDESLRAALERLGRAVRARAPR